MRLKTLILSVSAVTILGGCGGGQTSQETATYPVIKVEKSGAVIAEKYSATIEGRQSVEIYPQISGTISRLCVKEGQNVWKGQTMFVIDQVPYQAALRTAVANVQAAKAQVETARLENESKQALFEEDVISEYDLSQSRNSLAIAEAGLEQAKAQEINARNDLSYTEVKSPVDGVVGTLPYRAGALVGPSIPQSLTTVADIGQMYVYFSMTENQIRGLIRQYGSPAEVIERMPEIDLTLNDGSVYEEKGRIETISGIINPRTGTASVRCVFPNPKRILFSGGVGNVMLTRQEKDAIVIPQSVTYEIQDKIFVYKVIDGVAVASEIKVENLNDGKEYIVRDGLSVGDTLISEGVALLKDGTPVKVEYSNKQ